MGAHWIASFINDSGRDFLSEHKVEKDPDRRQPMTTHPPFLQGGGRLMLEKIKYLLMALLETIGVC